jgi:ADP-heptose:LPS heptosyltransferase
MKMCTYKLCYASNRLENISSNSKMRILFINHGPGIGDYIVKGLFPILNYHKKNPTHVLYYNQIYGYKSLKQRNYIEKIMNKLAVIVDSYNKSDYDKIINTTQLNGNKVPYSYWINNFRPLIHQHIYSIFKNDHNTDKFQIKDHYIVSISTDSQRFKGLTDEKFQEIIAEVILIKPNVKFALIGKKESILSNQLKEIISNPPKNLKSLLNKDDGLEDVMNILYNCKKLISRNSGLIHLAGILNINCIILKKYSTGCTNWFYNDFLFSNVEYHHTNQSEECHGFYNEVWFPISDNCIRVIEHKKLINYDVKEELIKIIN